MGNTSKSIINRLFFNLLPGRDSERSLPLALLLGLSFVNGCSGAVSFSQMPSSSNSSGTSSASSSLPPVVTATPTPTPTATVPATPACAQGVPFGGGTGTAADPFLICGPSQLQAIGTNLTASYQLSNNVDLSSSSFVAIGSSSTPFTGTFDGNSKVISNLTINTPTSDYTGLFSAIAGSSSIKNLTLTNVQITGQNYVGGLTGAIGGTASVVNCSSSGSVAGTANIVGGLVGTISAGTLSNSSSSAQVSGGQAVAGLVGSAYFTSGPGIVSHSFATGNVTGADHCIAGLVGDTNAATLSRSYATGNVTFGSDSGGGLVGCLDGDSYVVNSYATGTVVSLYAGFGGGLVGREYNLDSITPIVNSYSTGVVSGPAQNGGLVGGCTQQYTADLGIPGICGATTSSYWNVSTSGQASSYGLGEVGETTAVMQTASTFAQWDFTTIWNPPVANSGYPTLR